MSSHISLHINRRGLMFVLSSPSGAGKTTLTRLLREGDENLTVSISATTRPKRPGEVEGRDYHFITQDVFQHMIDNDEFLEYAYVFGYWYGTPKEPVLEALSQGHDVIFDIDWQGTQQIAQQARGDLVSLFILPPSMDSLHDRLKTRAQDTDDVIHQRMEKAAGEISHWAEYDYVVINDRIEDCLERVVSILKSERLRRERQVGLAHFVRELLA